MPREVPKVCLQRETTLCMIRAGQGRAGQTRANSRFCFKGGQIQQRTQFQDFVLEAGRAEGQRLAQQNALQLYQPNALQLARVFNNRVCPHRESILTMHEQSTEPNPKILFRRQVVWKASSPQNFCHTILSRRM